MASPEKKRVVTIETPIRDTAQMSPSSYASGTFGKPHTQGLKNKNKHSMPENRCSDLPCLPSFRGEASFIVGDRGACC